MRVQIDVEFEFVDCNSLKEEYTTKKIRIFYNHQCISEIYYETFDYDAQFKELKIDGGRMSFRDIIPYQKK